VRCMYWLWLIDVFVPLFTRSEFDRSHSIAVVDSSDEDVDDLRIVHKKAVEMKEIIAATSAVSKQLEKDRLKRAKEAGTLAAVTAAAAAEAADPKVAMRFQ
jgi:hypothetical protein